MAATYWLENCAPKACADCGTSCSLDESVPCSPDCEFTDEFGGPADPDCDPCATCDAINPYL